MFVKENTNRKKNVNSNIQTVSEKLTTCNISTTKALFKVHSNANLLSLLITCSEIENAMSTSQICNSKQLSQCSRASGSGSED